MQLQGTECKIRAHSPDNLRIHSSKTANGEKKLKIPRTAIGGGSGTHFKEDIETRQLYYKPFATGIAHIAGNSAAVISIAARPGRIDPFNPPAEGKCEKLPPIW